MSLVTGLLDALSIASGMAWEILWALILGFALSAAVQAVVSKAEMTRLLPDDSPRSIGVACGLGAASSSCSYVAVAEGVSFSSGSGVGLSGRLDKPDANHKLESRIGTRLLALRVGFVGLG